MDEVKITDLEDNWYVGEYKNYEFEALAGISYTRFF